MQVKPYSLFSIVLLCFSCSAAASEAPSLEQLINQRLGHMHDVARYKWLNKLPIEDLERESAVLAAAERSGLQNGITTTSSRRFFSLQIEAAKEIQRYWFEQWHDSMEPPIAAPDLRADIRPKLITLGAQILEKLTRANSVQVTVQAIGLSHETASKMSRAVAEIDRYSNQLTQITDSGVLRVGTTFDYAPFSYKQNDGPQGIDVALAQNLARSLGVNVVWVETSWPTLMQDLKEGLFDIGMSGISLNLARQKVAFFSLPHHTGGKTPIGRCSDKKRFSHLEQIDQPTTRIIVNPGGTNQRFVDSTIKNANIRVHADNRTIFHELLNETADVMFTDAIEVRLQTSIHPDLCGLLAGKTLTFQQKGFLMPQDIEFKLYVDAWLNQRIAEGLVEKTFSHHLSAITEE